VALFQALKGARAVFGQGPGGVCRTIPDQEHEMKRLYNILFTIFFVMSAPYYFLKMWRRGRWKEGFPQRFGRFSSKIKQAVTNRHVLCS
jgi:hypothetical protein